MTLRDLLEDKKTIILQRWLHRVLEDYPQETQAFFREKKSPYSNPIGFTLRKGMEGIIEELLRPGAGGEAREILEPVMKVRAVENFAPSQGEKFILPLREVLAEIGKEEKKGDLLERDWIELNSRIHQLELLSMNLYTECREKVNRLKIMEREKRGGGVLDRRAGV